MDHIQLKNFVLLAQTLNFSAVAKQEFISQPALTKQINRLEDELGVRLFHRTKHGVCLTYAGEAFYRHAVAILDEVEKAVHHMESIRQGHTGSLRISAIYSLDDEVTRHLERFTGRYPKVDVSITSGTGSQQILSINSQTDDLYFSFSPLLALYPGLDTVPLSDDRFAVYVSEREAERLRRDGLACLDEMTHLVEYRSEGGPLFTGMVFSIREAIGLKSGRIAYYPSNSTILIAVKAGMGFALLPSMMNFGSCPDGIVKIPLDMPEARIKRALGWHRNSKNCATTRFVELLCDAEAVEPA